MRSGPNPLWEDRPRWTFVRSAPAARGMHTQTWAFGEVRASKRALGTAPMSLPLWAVSMSEPPLMNCQWLTGSAPLLQSALPSRLGGASTATAPCGKMMMPK